MLPGGERVEAVVEPDLDDGVTVLSWNGLGRSLRMTRPGVILVELPSMGDAGGES